jgi:hypothetical protein
MVFFVFASLGVWKNLLASEVTLVRLISEPENDLVHSLVLNLDDSLNIIQIIRVSKVDEQRFTPEDLQNGEMVLAKNSGRDVIKLRCGGKCNNVTGGPLTLSCLYNGITNSYRLLNVNLSKTETSWRLTTSKGEQIKTLRIKARKILGKMVGATIHINQ